MRDEFSTSTAPDPRCGFIWINQQKLTANGPNRHGGQAANKVGNYKINCPSYSPCPRTFKTSMTQPTTAYTSLCNSDSCLLACIRGFVLHGS